MDFHVYIIGTENRDVFSTGVTNNIGHCLQEYRQNCREAALLSRTPERLVYFETYDRMEHALSREADLRQEEHDVMVSVVEDLNPEWDDLYQSL